MNRAKTAAGILLNCPLLKGPPRTSGMRGGAVKLKPGESVGWNSTGEHEEELVILHGKGAANIDGQADLPVHEKMLAYIPSRTKHNVTNTGRDTLEYVWVVRRFVRNDEGGKRERSWWPRRESNTRPSV